MRDEIAVAEAQGSVMTERGTGHLVLRFTDADEAFDTVPDIGKAMIGRPAGETSEEFIRRMQSSGTPEEAVTYAAFAMNPREAVWWAHECLVHLNENLRTADQEMMALVERWVREPSEETRRAALDGGMGQEDTTPGGWLALAAGWSGGSMAPEGTPDVAPPPHLFSQAVNAALMSMLATVDWRQRSQVLNDFVEIAFSVAAKE